MIKIKKEKIMSKLKTFSIAGKIAVNFLVRAKNKKEAIKIVTNTVEDLEYEVVDFGEREVDIRYISEIDIK